VGETPAAPDLVHQLNEAFVAVAEKVSPTVVVVDVVSKPPPMDAPADGDDSTESDSPDFWRFFHRQFDEPSDPPEGQGSGVIIRQDGYILTNSHVVENPQTIQVRLRDGRSFKATVRGVDAKSDLAVLKIETNGLPVAVFGDSARTRVGEFAIAIGAPFNLDYSVTFGHVSAKGRSNLIEGLAGRTADQDYIQTDANINPGNSGGPLVNIDGQVIGINSLIRGFHTGIGFAIPSNLAKEVSEQIIAQGKFTRAWLGVGIVALRDAPNVRGAVKGVDDGVIVSEIESAGPAAKSELKLHDIIMAIDGTPIGTAQQLRNQVRGKPIGQPIMLQVFRPNTGGDGKVVQISVSPAEWVEAPVVAAKPTKRSVPADTTATGLGLTVHRLTGELADHLGIEHKEGVLVVAVQEDSPAAHGGIEPGDVITSIDLQPVTNPKQFSELIKKGNPKKGIRLNLVSGRTKRFEVLKEESQ
jgi:serine protease Do